MSDITLTVRVTEETKARLEALAEKNGYDLDTALAAALDEYIETWEDYHKTVEAIESGDDERRALKVVND